jgi:outer membrane immunogenic protein
MKKLFTFALSAATILAGLTGAAQANAPMTYSGDMNWAGAYAGAHIGLMRSGFDHGSNANAGPDGSDLNGMGGVQAGYNWQRDRIVFGGEVDFSYTPLEGTRGVSKFEENWTSTMRGRAGYTFGAFLPYATFGLALTDTDSKLTSGGSASNTAVGYAAGVGVDVAAYKALTWRAEYLHVGVTDQPNRINGTNYVGGSSNDMLRIGVNYHFN